MNLLTIYHYFPHWTHLFFYWFAYSYNSVTFLIIIRLGHVLISDKACSNSFLSFEKLLTFFPILLR